MFTGLFLLGMHDNLIEKSLLEKLIDRFYRVEKAAIKNAH
jgi:hypothetical protein